MKDKNTQEKARVNILAAVEELLLEEGYNGLYIRNIARKANTSGKMIYYHFGSLENLMETYIREKDYWKEMDEDLDGVPSKSMPPDVLMKSIFRSHFESFEKSKEMQRLILWEISQYTVALRKESDEREKFGEKVYQRVDPQFEGSDLDFRSVSALITAGIYYMVLHAKTNGGTFCGRDINNVEDRELLLKTIDQLVDMSFCKTKQNVLHPIKRLQKK